MNAAAEVRRDGRGDALFSAEARSGWPEPVERGDFERGGVGKGCASGVSVGLPLGGMALARGGGCRKMVCRIR